MRWGMCLFSVNVWRCACLAVALGGLLGACSGEPGPDDSIEGMRALNNMLEGTNLPRLNMDAMERLFTRDSLSILGIAP